MIILQAEAWRDMLIEMFTSHTKCLKYNSKIERTIAFDWMPRKEESPSFDNDYYCVDVLHSAVLARI